MYKRNNKLHLSHWCIWQFNRELSTLCVQGVAVYKEIAWYPTSSFRLACIFCLVWLFLYKNNLPLRCCVVLRSLCSLISAMMYISMLHYIKHQSNALNHKQLLFKFRSILSPSITVTGAGKLGDICWIASSRGNRTITHGNHTSKHWQDSSTIMNNFNPCG